MTVLVFHLGSLGDTVVTIPLLRAVRRRWPDARIVMLHNASASGVATPSDVLDGSGLVDAYLPYRRSIPGAAGSWRALYATWRDIRRLGADVAVFAGPSDRSGRALARDRLFFRSAGITHLSGFNTCPAHGQASGADATAHEARRKLDRLGPDLPTPAAALFAPPLVVPDAAAIGRVSEWRRTIVGDTCPLVAVGPGSLMPAKAWPLERFGELGRRILQHDAVPVVVGGDAERALGADLTRQWSGGVNAAGAWSVLESAALLASCRAYVGIDSGAAHLAAAVGTPTVVLTSGRAPRGQWDPLGAGHVVLRHRTPCEGCRHVSCPLTDHPCMRGLSTDDAWRALAPLLGGTRS